MTELDNPTNIPAEAREYMTEAYRHNESRLYKKAIAQCDLAIQIAPNWAESYNFKGFLLRKLGRKDEAAAAYRDAIRLDPSLYDPAEKTQ